MPGIETLIWILTGCTALISILSGTVWSLIRAEAKEQAEQIKKKADSERVHEVEARWQQDLVNVKESNEKLINKLELRHDRELDALATRLGEQIRNTENNILTQMRLMVEVFKQP